MKYAIYDKATNGYLTDMDVDIVCSTDTRFTCAYAEYITNAKLLDTKEAATDVVARIEGFKFMDKGRFVIHSFDDTLKDQYIISEAGTPTKVVDNITVDLDGTVNVKYGTMLTHWSTASLEYAINRMNTLQKAVSSIYTSWNDTFMVYKVITIMDERSCGHYQFINVTAEGLKKYSKDEKEKLLVVGKELTDITEPLNKRIEELEKANYELGEQVTERGAVANSLLDKNNSFKAKVEAIKKEAHDWKKLYENADADREELKNVIDIIHTDLVSSTAYDDLKDTLKAINCNSGLDHISMRNFLTAKDEIRSIISHVIVILESRELNQSVAFSSAEEVDRAKKLANDIIDICEATTDTFEVTLKKFSQLYEAVNDPGDDDDTIMYAFKGVLEIFSSLEDHVKSIIDESVTWKHKTQKAEKELEDQKKLNEANNVTIVRYRNERRDMDKENHELRTARDCSAEVIFAIRNAIYNNDGDAFRCIENRMKLDADFNSNPFMAGVRENIKDICSAEKKNIANHELKNSEIARLTNERDKALERAEKFKGIANSVYGITIPGRCNGKQMFCDITTGKKILIDKEKYNDLMECVNNISLTYEMMKLTPFSMDRPSWLSGIINRINNLTK